LENINYSHSRTLKNEFLQNWQILQIPKALVPEQIWIEIDSFQAEAGCDNKFQERVNIVVVSFYAVYSKG